MGETAPLLATTTRRRRSVRTLSAGVILAGTSLFIIFLTWSPQSFSPLLHAEEDTEAVPPMPAELFSQWTVSDVAGEGLAGGLNNVSCASVPHMLRAPVYRFAELWLAKHTGCSGGPFVCEAAFEESLQTRSFWIRGTCGVQPAVYGLHIARPNMDTAANENPARGLRFKGKKRTNVSPCQARETLRDGTIIHRDELQKLECELQLIQVVLVAAALQDLAVPGSVLATRPHRINIEPHFILSSREKLERTMMGIKMPSKKQLDEEPVTQVLATANHPTSYDFVATYPQCGENAIVSQGDCGGCYAFAASRVISSALCMVTNAAVNIEMSEQQGISCYDSDGCAGGWATNFFDELQAAGGYSTRRCLPYVAEDASGEGGVLCSAACTDDSKYTITSYTRIQWASEADDTSIEAALLQYGPLWTCTRVCAGFYTYSGSGVFSDPYTSDCSTCIHAVTIVGYTPTTWRIANSWGTAWGDNGFMNVARGANMALDLEWTYAVVPDTSISSTCPGAPTCTNGGSLDASCACWCPPGYGGADCSACSLTCQNGGVLSSGTCTCTCQQGYFGNDCGDVLTLQWSAYTAATKTASFTLTYSLDSYFPATSSQGSNVLQRYSDPSRSTFCSNCNFATVTSADGAVTLSNEDLTLGFGRPNYEHCYSVLLSRGQNQFAVALAPVRVDFPCFYLRASTTLPGGFCLDGGTPITDKTDPMYEWQCTAPAPLPTPAPCKDTVQSSICAYWKSRQYCLTSSIYFPYVSARCAGTCGLTC